MWNLGLYSLLSNLTVKNVLKSQVHTSHLKWTSHEKKVQERDIITNPFKYRAHTLPKYWLKMLFCVSAHSSQIMSKDSFQINCNSLLIPLFFFFPSAQWQWELLWILSSSSSVSCSDFSPLCLNLDRWMAKQNAHQSHFSPFSKFSGKDIFTKIY